MAAFEEGHNEALGIQIRRQGVLVDGIDVIDFQEIVVGCLPVTVHLDDYGVFDDQILKREICCFRSDGGKELSKRLRIVIQIDEDHSAPGLAPDGQQAIFSLFDARKIVRFGHRHQLSVNRISQTVIGAKESTFGTGGFLESGNATMAANIEDSPNPKTTT